MLNKEMYSHYVLKYLQILLKKSLKEPKEKKSHHTVHDFHTCILKSKLINPK